MVASTVGGVGGFWVRSIVLRSNTTTPAFPIAVNRVFPSGVTSSPSGPDIGLTPLAREAQHCAPGNPPKWWLAPKPEIRWKVGPPTPDKSVLHPNLVKLPTTSTVGGIMSLPAASVAHGLAWFPAPVTALVPWIALTAMLLTVSNTTTANPIRSEV